VLYKILKSTLFCFLCFIVFSCSCATPSSQSYSPTDLSVPLSSFLKVDVNLLIRKCSEETEMCEIQRRDFISGSAIVVKRARHGGMYVLSVAHICDPSDYANRVSGGDPWSLEMVGITKEHDEYRLHVLEVDHDKDLCLMYAPDLDRTPIAVAKKKLMPGSRIWNIAAPRGILYKGAPIIIDGIFNGTNQDSGHDMYTMLVAGGSSGSGILNENGEIVGLVSMMDLRFPFIVYSPAHEDILEFFNRAVAYHSTVGAPVVQEIIYKIVLPELPSLPKMPKFKFPDLSGVIEWFDDKLTQFL